MYLNNKDEIIKFFEELSVFLNLHLEKSLSFYEYISSKNMNYNRHFTTANRFSFNIEEVFWRFSGARFCIIGMEDELYEIHIERVIFSEIKENRITIIENLGSNITRKSIITII